MYNEHPSFIPPLADAVLWRYMDFTKFVSLLDKGALFFARADKLGDPFEGVWTTRTQEAFFNSSPDLQGISKTIRRFTLISCWHENSYESDAMWSLYSRERAGIAIKTDFSSFKQGLVSDTDIYVGKVSYIDYDRDFIPGDNLFNPFLYKRRSFEHENEVRAINIELSKGFDQDICEIGIYYEVDLSLLIHEVIVAPYAEDWFLELIQSVAARYNLQAPVRKSSLAAEPVWVRF